ncbi:MAG TPA: type II toxin-antitoxin system Phd/YefM family antitoxin [Desulfatiglandales bacterium]|nr:type II toxin-antitoxin system Phd/YefM family antitoxin [Desulfatiglandales bacterium]
MNEQTISVAEAKKSFSELLGKVAFRKDRIIITKKGRPMACLVPAEQSVGHLGDIKGWLDKNDSFFETMNNIVQNRKDHIPRILKKRQGK